MSSNRAKGGVARVQARGLRQAGRGLGQGSRGLAPHDRFLCLGGRGAEHQPQKGGVGG